MAAAKRGVAPPGSGAGRARDDVDHEMFHFFEEPQRRSSALALTAIFAIFVRQCVAANGYSGAGKPPMFGDYEAQRHWMEITTNLPLSEWYHASPRNDLQYWGLDYPPLTAWHSWLLGRAAALWEPAMVALGTSRGYENATSKFFMRWSVIVSELLVLFPAVYAALVASPLTRRLSFSGRVFGAWLVLLNPAFVLIDHGHFQYNCVCLGLALGAVAALARGRVFLASALFVLSIAFKQMALYWAPAFFFFLLGQALALPTPAARVARVAALGAVVLGTFGLVCSPFITSLADAAQLWTRVFPVGRGLFEDKVANFWCASNLVLKWRALLSPAAQLRLATAATLAAMLPACVAVLRRPTLPRFLFAMAASAFAFFLFSFQVHEKSILLPLLPCCVLALGNERLRAAFAWLSVVATASMYPLLVKDDLRLPYFALQLFYLWFNLFWLRAPQPAKPAGAALPWLQRLAMLVSFAALVMIHLANALFPANPRYPDVGTYLFVLYGAAHFALAWLVCTALAWRPPAGLFGEGDKED
jgi:alpha-1,3-glucosyltransferase